MSAQVVPKTVVLGDEYDEKLREQLLATLSELGAQTVDQWRGIGGSQEIDRLNVVIDGKAIEVEAETYIGLTIIGDPDLIDRIARRVRERMSGAPA